MPRRLGMAVVGFTWIPFPLWACSLARPAELLATWRLSHGPLLMADGCTPRRSPLV